MLKLFDTTVLEMNILIYWFQIKFLKLFLYNSK